MKKILNLVSKSDAMSLDSFAKNNKDYFNLAAGDPYGPPIIPYESSLFELSHDNKQHSHYCSAQGKLELRELLYNNPEKVIIGNGSKILVYLSLLATCEPEDTVLFIGPMYNSYIEMGKILGLKMLMYIPFYKFDGWKNDLFELEKYFLNSNISAVIFVNPSNPTGIVEGKYFVNGLTELCKEYDCWLIADEIYSNIIYNNTEFETCLDKNNNVIYINGFSKWAAVPGYRIGYCIAQEDLIKQMTQLQSQIAGPPNTLIQDVTINFLKIKDDYQIPLVKRNKYEEIVNKLCENNKLFTKYKPQGAFYFYLPVKDSKKTCEELFKNKIIVTPGEAYGIDNTIRISFANLTYDDVLIVKPYLDAIN